MKRLGTRVNLIPVVAKADTLTQNDLFAFKQRVRALLLFAPSSVLNVITDPRGHSSAGHPSLPGPAGRGGPGRGGHDTPAERVPPLLDHRLHRGREDARRPRCQGPRVPLGCGRGCVRPPFCPFTHSRGLQSRTTSTATSAGCARFSSARTCST
jgi:hypothetical protein